MASVTARLTATKVLPAWGFDEVKRTHCRRLWLDTFMKFMFERSMRKASERASRPASRTATMPFVVSPS